MISDRVSILFAAAAAGCGGNPIAPMPAPPPAGEPVVDIHCHTAGIGAGGSGCFISPSLRDNPRYGLYLDAFDVTEAELTREGDGLVIKRLHDRLSRSSCVQGAVILALDGVVKDGELDREKTQCYVPNDFVAAEVKKYPNLYFGASINPYRSDAIHRLERAYRQGAVLVKWIPSVMMIDPADPRLMPFYLRMKSLGLPLLCHTGKEKAFPTARDELSDPIQLRFPLSLGVTVIAAHAAGFGRTDGRRNWERLLPMFKEFPNLYADISALTLVVHLDHLRRLAEYKGLHGRLVYGSDMPLIGTFLFHPLWAPWDFSFPQLTGLLFTGNVWDRDVLWKKAAGYPDPVFTRTARLLRLPPRPTQ
jgi:hypothetical protein